MLNLQEITRKARPLSIDNLEDIGDILQYLIPWGALLAVALQGNSAAAHEWLYAGVSTVVLTFILKYAFNFTPLGKRPDGNDFSFPSGHTPSAFMGAAFFHFHFGFEWAVLPYLLAALTGYSRVWAGKHWWRDIFAGAGLAMLIGYIVLELI